MPVILGDKTSIDIWLNGSASEIDSVAGPYEGPDLVRTLQMPAKLLFCCMNVLR